MSRNDPPSPLARTTARTAYASMEFASAFALALLDQLGVATSRHATTPRDPPRRSRVTAECRDHHSLHSGRPTLARGHLRSIAPALALALFAAACGGTATATRESEPAAHISPSTADPTTTTTLPQPLSPLTGMLGDPTTLARPALAVKIDNVKDAHPQSGINQADVVYEE